MPVPQRLFMPWSSGWLNSFPLMNSDELYHIWSRSLFARRLVHRPEELHKMCASKFQGVWQATPEMLYKSLEVKNAFLHLPEEER